jgi:hypothetical protein
MQIILICSLVLCAIFKIISISRKSDEERKKQADIHRIEMLEERNYQLYYFQSRLIYRFGSDVLNAMSDYKEILYSDKPLEAKHLVDVDKLVNLN